MITATPPEAVPESTIPADWQQRAERTPGISRFVAGQWAHMTIGDVRVQVAGLAPGNITNIAP
jgi:hypothetical protein